MAKGLGELLYAVLQTCALFPNWDSRELLYSVLQIFAVISALTSNSGLRELLYAVLQICAVSFLCCAWKSCFMLCCRSVLSSVL